MTPEIEKEEFIENKKPRVMEGKYRICLALSGGGFRAAIFHLGVIRRLEEAGIMKDVDVISGVSGGAIIAAYYVCQMEAELRQHKPDEWNKTATRLACFEKIAEQFLKRVDHNLRTRALIFTPFFHPILFVKTLALKVRRAGARSELIQKEYDDWFYEDDTIDQLPSVTPERLRKGEVALYGPKVILNTTSLLTGKRVSFSREPNSGMNELKRSNKNSLPLSRVVGASSGVPVLFPPTYIYGDVLVDGGVADNQGIEALLADDEVPENFALLSEAEREACQEALNKSQHILLVSDASGQLEPQHTMSTGEAAVFMRTNEILQFQIRSKLIDRLVKWMEDQRDHRYFAFIHLFLNLKDRGVTYRLPSEMIPGVARIRTDLDQFSPTECDALMYHGYTLIDEQIKKYCRPLKKEYFDRIETPLAAPPLFQPACPALKDPKERDKVRGELEYGSQSVYLVRSLKKYPGRVVPVMVLWAAAWVGTWWLFFSKYTKPLEILNRWITEALGEATAAWIGIVADWLLRYARLPARDVVINGISSLLSAGALVALAGYVLAFFAFLMVRQLAMRADRKNYYRFTGKRPTTSWEPVKGVATPPPTTTPPASH